MNGSETGGDSNRDGCGFLSLAELDRAVEGRLEAARRAAFDSHVDDGCGACALLAADLEIFVEVARDGLREAEREEYERGAEMLEARLRRKAVPAIWQGWKSVAAAAVIVAAVGLGLFQLRQPALPGASIDIPQGGAIAVEPMPFREPPILRGEPSVAEIWERAGVAYENRRFRRAAELFSEIPPSATGAGDAALYRGIALLMLGESRAARQALDQAREIAERDELPSGSIDWFAALAALAEGDTPSAVAALERAAAAGGPYAESAAELLDRLR